MTDQNTVSNPPAEGEDPLAELERIVSGRVDLEETAHRAGNLDLKAELLRDLEQESRFEEPQVDPQGGPEVDLPNFLSAGARPQPADTFQVSEPDEATTAQDSQMEMSLQEQLMAELSDDLKSSTAGAGPAADVGMELGDAFTEQVEQINRSDQLTGEIASDALAQELNLDLTADEPVAAVEAPTADFRSAPAAAPHAAPGIAMVGEPIVAEAGAPINTRADAGVGNSIDAGAADPELEGRFAEAFAEEMFLEAEAPSLDKEPQHPAAPELQNELQTQAPPPPITGIETPADPGSPSHIDNQADIQPEPEAAKPAGSRTGFRMAIGALALALVAGIGVVGWSTMNNESGAPTSEPPVIKADSEPAKVKPVDPGGREIANQDNKVYERVAGKQAGEPAQETLISSRQEPVRVEKPASKPVAPAKNGENAAEGKTTNEDEAVGDPVQIAAVEPKGANRLAPDSADKTASANPLGLSPKRVKTFTVKPDGTIVTAPKPLAIAPVAPEGNSAAQQSAAVDTANQTPDASRPENIAIDGAKTTGQIAVPTPSPRPAPKPARASTAPAAKPEAKTQQKPANTGTASLQPATAEPQSNAQVTVSSSKWKVQVSSQRSRVAAEDEFRNLRRRFGTLLSQRTAAIQSAEVNGKMYYRVKVLTGSKADADRLCASLKNAGGSCFVTR